MLGSMVLDVFLREDCIDVCATARGPKEADEIQNKYPAVETRMLDVETANSKDILKVIHGSDWVINCIGLIKPYIHDDNIQEVERAIRVNAVYPYDLAKAAEKTKAKVIQIETDCVYSGKKGNYIEDDKHDPTDVYGKTKSSGEVFSPNVYHLRDSIIGPELNGHVSFMDWFINQQKDAAVSGYTNHKWNGVTTYHFAKICLGIIGNNLKLPCLQHVIAADKPSKAKMLEYFSKYFNREDIRINPVKAPVVIDRTLATKDPKTNLRIWEAAGYKKPPTVSEMIKELAEYLQNGKN